MKAFLVIILFVYVQLISAQTFTEIFDHPFHEVKCGSIAFTDVDNDQDEDVLISGTLGFGLNITKLYFNDGDGSFTEAEENSFEQVYSGPIAFADVDGDGDEDVFIAGYGSGGFPVVKLYTNDGQGYFTEVEDVLFEGVEGGSIAFSDIDNDGDEDVLITGLTDPGYALTKLYRNDGQGNFSIVAESGLDHAYDSSVAFSDIDGDNDEDVFIVGRSSINPFEQTAKLYLNNGQGYFTLQTGTPFESQFLRSASFADVDGDQDEDVLVTGIGEAVLIGDTLLLVGDTLFTDIYTNDGEGNFTKMEGTPMEGAIYGSSVFADINGDDDKDIIITGATGPYEAPAKIAKLYTNDGQGNFTEVMLTPFEGIDQGAVAFSDIDGDNDMDMLLTGSDNDRNKVTKLYLNDMVSATSEVSFLQYLQYTLLPNPSTGEQLNLSIKPLESGQAIITGYDSYGRVVFQQVEILAAGLQLIPLEVKTLPKGTYFVEINHGKCKGVQKLFIH